MSSQQLACEECGCIVEGLTQADLDADVDWHVLADGTEVADPPRVSSYCDECSAQLRVLTR